MAKQKILIIVVTRADIPRGRGDDEFAEDWGQNKEENIFWLDIDAGDIYFLVLHGCEENKEVDYPTFFQNAIKKKGDSSFNKIGKIYLGYHGIDLKDLQPLKDKIKERFNGDRLQEPFKYSSSNDKVHNFAMFDLLNQLENKYKVTGIYEHVFNKLKGRLPFIHQLHCLQSELLRLHFCIATVVNTSNNLKESAIEDAQNAVSEITKVLQREGFQAYFKKFKPTSKTMIAIKEATALLDIFKNNDSYAWAMLQNKNFWSKSTENKPYKELKAGNLPSLEMDFRVLASAVDCSLDAASI